MVMNSVESIANALRGPSIGIEYTMVFVLEISGREGPQVRKPTINISASTKDVGLWSVQLVCCVPSMRYVGIIRCLGLGCTINSQTLMGSERQCDHRRACVI